VRDWVLRGADGHEPYATFAARWAQARARAIAVLLEQVRDAGASGDWRAAAWLLERAAPDEYPRDPAVQVTTHVHPGADVAGLLARLTAPPTSTSSETARTGHDPPHR
jgi:hypothetical protein